MADRALLTEQYKKLAKQANMRLLRLEKRAGSNPALLDWAYAHAQEDIRKWRGSGKHRYPSTVKQDAPISQLQARIADVEKFLEMETSTISGVKRVNEKRVDTINNKYGTDFTSSDFQQFARSGMLDKIKAQYGSKTMWKAIGQIRKNMDTLVKQMKQHKAREIIVDEDDPILQATVDEILSSRRYGKTLINLLK